MKKRSYEWNNRNTAQLVVKMEPELRKRFKKVSRERGESMGGLVRGFVARWLRENEEKENEQEN